MIQNTALFFCLTKHVELRMYCRHIFAFAPPFPAMTTATSCPPRPLSPLAAGRLNEHIAVALPEAARCVQGTAMTLTSWRCVISSLLLQGV